MRSLGAGMVIVSLFYMAIIVEAMTAALRAGRRSMDWFGVCLLACATALGGGTTRDVLLDHYPLLWVAHPHYLAVIIGAALATIALARFMERLRTMFLLLDAVGLVTLTIIGCRVALEAGHPLFIVVLAGMITGCTGGVIRDILCNEVPLLFRGELYATVSIVAGSIYLAGLHFGIAPDVIALIAIVIGFCLRTAAIFRKWEWPKFIYNKDWH